MLKNSEANWGSVAKLLHWSMAVLILFQIPLGIAADQWRLSPTKIDLFILHKSIGMLLLLLVAIRLTWRLCNPVPKLPVNMPAWQQLGGHISHGLLYFCLVALPLSGWVINSASNIPFRVFWLFKLPAITDPDKALEATVKSVHGGLSIALAVLLVMHIGAACHHHFVRRDNVLLRMLSGMEKSG